MKFKLVNKYLINIHNIYYINYINNDLKKTLIRTNYKYKNLTKIL
jgi:hypothetical protein